MERQGSRDGARPRVEVRAATRADAALLFAWVNDPTTRANSFSPEQIGWSTHLAWLDDRLGSSGSRLYIGSLEDEPIGQVRFDLEPDGDVEVGITVAPQMRGRGVGRVLLEAGLAAVVAEGFGLAVVARVRSDNPVSVSLFRAAGFDLAGESACAGMPCLVFRRSLRRRGG